MPRKRILLIDDQETDVMSIITALESNVDFASKFEFVRENGNYITFPTDIFIANQRITGEKQKEEIVQKIIGLIDDFQILLLDMKLIDDKRETEPYTSFNVISELKQSSISAKFDNKDVVLITGYGSKTERIDYFQKSHPKYLVRVKYDIHNPLDPVSECQNDANACSRCFTDVNGNQQQYDKQNPPCTEAECFAQFLIQKLSY